MGSVLRGKTGKYNRALREPEQAPLGAKMASQWMLRLTLPCAMCSVAQAELRPCSSMLRNAHPRLRLKRQLLTSKH